MARGPYSCQVVPRGFLLLLEEGGGEEAGQGARGVAATGRGILLLLEDDGGEGAGQGAPSVAASCPKPRKRVM